MGITKFAVKYPVSVLMITLGVCLLGIISYNKLGTDLFPDLKNPALYIDLQAGERPPEEIEKQFVEKIGDYTVLTTSINYASTRDLMLKRLMDIAGGLVGCLITGILFIFVAPAIYIASPGPIFFAQNV